MTTAARREPTGARAYATITAAGVVLIGVGGLLLGDESLLGVLTSTS